MAIVVGGIKSIGVNVSIANALDALLGLETVISAYRHHIEKERLLG